MKAWLDAALIFTFFMSAMMGIVWMTNKITTLVEPIILPILEKMQDEDDE